MIFLLIVLLSVDFSVLAIPSLENNENTTGTTITETIEINNGPANNNQSSEVRQSETYEDQQFETFTKTIIKPKEESNKSNRKENKHHHDLKYFFENTETDEQENVPEVIDSNESRQDTQLKHDVLEEFIVTGNTPKLQRSMPLKQRIPKSKQRNLDNDMLNTIFRENFDAERGLLPECEDAKRNRNSKRNTKIADKYYMQSNEPLHDDPYDISIRNKEPVIFVRKLNLNFKMK